MNVNELTSSLYGANMHSTRNIGATGYTHKLLNKEGKAEGVSESFSDILSSYALSDNPEDIEDVVNGIQNSIKSLDEEDNSDSEGVNKGNVMNILTDAHVAKEYLESQSGRNLIVSMAQNQIASIIAGNNNNE